jgi:hypothetical protein
VIHPDPVGSGSLKLVAVDAPKEVLRRVEAALRQRTGAPDVRRVAGAWFFVHSEAEPADIRDSLAPLLGDGDSVIVVEFERWSSHGAAIDTRWLLRRGH